MLAPLADRIAAFGSGYGAISRPLTLHDRLQHRGMGTVKAELVAAPNRCDSGAAVHLAHGVEFITGRLKAHYSR